MIVVPDDFAIATIEREGAAGREWIDALPGRVEALCERWGLAIDGPPVHGYLGLVVPASRGKEACMLKVSWVDESYTGEVTALRAWQGRGAVLLLEEDVSQGAILMERLDPGRSLNDLEIGNAITIAGRLLRRLAIPAPEGVRSLKNVASGMARDLPERWERYGRPMPRALLHRAVDLAGDLGAACNENLLVNFDLHYADVLAGRREPWLAVDPMVVAGNPEYGIAQLLWRRLEDIQARGGLERHFRALIEAAELDLSLARGWTLVRCVDYWLWGLSVGLTYDPARCETITNWLSKEKPKY